MNSFTIALLVSSVAVAVNAQGQNAADTNDSNSRPAPTIEDRLGQLEQDQQDLSGRVETLSNRIADLQKEMKALENQSGDSNDGSSQSRGGSSNARNDGAPDHPSRAPDNSAAATTNDREGASYDIFYDRLQSDGRWFSDATYGYVWQPNTASTDQNWRPYADGRWVYTDRGWTWVSNEDFGWATYHYGRWARLSDTGWVWVPGTTWAPAWVSWRQSDDYVGWAPLPPEAESGQQDFRIEGWADTYYNIGPTSYVFVKTADLANKSYRDLIASPHDNLDIISRTKNVTNISNGNLGVIDNGPDYDQLVQRSNVKIDRYRLNYVQQSDPQAQFSATARGQQLEMVAPAPRLQRAATVEPKTAGDITKAQVDRGWQNIEEARAKQLKQTWARQAPVPASLPAKPAPPKPLFVRAAGQGQDASQQPNPAPATQQSNQRLNNETTFAPGQSPSLNEKAAPSGQQPSSTNENQRQDLKQGERVETTPPAPNPSPSPNEKVARPGQQPSSANENQRQELKQGERRETTPPAPNPSPSPDEKVARPGEQSPNANENRRQQRQGERSETTPAPSRAEPSQSKNERPAQSEEKREKGDNLDQETSGAAGGAGEKGEMPQKEGKATRQLKNSGETPARGEGQQPENDQSSRKFDLEKTDKKGQSRDESGNEKKSGGKKRSDESEKKKVAPSEQ